MFHTSSGFVQIRSNVNAHQKRGDQMRSHDPARSVPRRSLKAPWGCRARCRVRLTGDQPSAVLLLSRIGFPTNCNHFARRPNRTDPLSLWAIISNAALAQPTCLGLERRRQHKNPQCTRLIGIKQNAHPITYLYVGRINRSRHSGLLACWHLEEPRPS
jgi:hypothetical protein